MTVDMFIQRTVTIIIVIDIVLVQTIHPHAYLSRLS